MNFFDALRAVVQGFRITKLEWKDDRVVVFLNGTLKIKKPDGVHDLIISDGDMFGEDWVIVRSMPLS